MPHDRKKVKRNIQPWFNNSELLKQWQYEPISSKK